MEFMLDYDWNRLAFLWNLEERLLNHMGFVVVIIIIIIQENIHASCSNFDVIKLALALLGKPTCAGI